MLSTLHIENIAVIESADVLFGRGLNILTGETGSGKSIVIDSINAITGARTPRDIIRTGAKNAYISALFQGISFFAIQKLEQIGITPDEEGSLLITREMTADGRNLCYLNGRPATVSQLKSAGETLINIHGQHTSRILLDTSLHIGFLDDVSENEREVFRYRDAYAQLRELERKIASADIDENEKRRRIDTLSYQIDEIETAGLSEDEEDELISRRKLLSNAERLTTALSAAYMLINGSDDEPGAYERISLACAELSQIAGYDKNLSSLSERLNDVKFIADDCASDIARLLDEYDFSPDELDRVESRLDQIYRLKKHGMKVSEILEYLEKAKIELAEIEYSSERLAELQAKREEALNETLKLGRELRKSREAGASLLKTRMHEELSLLNMENVVFDVEFTNTEPTSKGCETVQFLISVNKGEALKPLARVASGGELSRIMLALLNVLTDEADTLVFDEIDTGVGGRAAQRVGYKLSTLAMGKQVLCVTHLSQIAVLADEHFAISKYIADDRTKTRVEPLNFEGRMNEVARINSGEIITESALDSAREQLNAAAEYKISRSQNINESI